MLYRWTHSSPAKGKGNLSAVLDLIRLTQRVQYSHSWDFLRDSLQHPVLCSSSPSSPKSTSQKCSEPHEDHSFISQLCVGVGDHGARARPQHFTAMWMCILAEPRVHRTAKKKSTPFNITSSDHVFFPTTWPSKHT